MPKSKDMLNDELTKLLESIDPSLAIKYAGCQVRAKRNSKSTGAQNVKKTSQNKIQNKGTNKIEKRTESKENSKPNENIKKKTKPLQVGKHNTVASQVMNQIKQN